ncbi:GTP binding domain [Trypanosoma melophagium]|uniref:GTP binding domain n=1 Tax=Trypanosoma melophagium TaxID=715481 RepID=UPI00351A8733|nr:GTP binding domain [Trypanosoma melophagium]
MPPFSGKQKKKQLQERRQRKRQQDEERTESRGRCNAEKDHKRTTTNNIRSKSEDQLSSSSSSNNNNSKDSYKNSSSVGGRNYTQEEYKYGADRRGVRSVFLKETAEEIAARKKLSYEPLAQRTFMDDNGIPFGSWFRMPGHTDAAIIPFAFEMPTRGWTPENGKEKEEITGTVQDQRSTSINDGSNSSSHHNESENDTDAKHESLIEAREAARFKAYLSTVDNYPLPPALQSLRVSTYERNLDVWRQLWRTVEQSDVVVIVADARYPIVHLPLSLLHYIVQECCKPCVILLNKADLVPKHMLDKWMRFLPRYFEATGIVPNSTAVEEAANTKSGVVRSIPLLPFTSLPAENTAIGAEDTCNTAKRRKKNKRRTKLYEQLRTGKLQLAVDGEKGIHTGKGKKKKNTKYNGDEDDNDDDSEEEGEERDSSDNETSDNNNNNNEDDVYDKEDAYAVTENFKGMRKAERELQQGRREYKELKIVSDMISTLLQQCRDLADAHKKSNNNNNNNNNNNSSEESPLHIGLVGHPNVGKSSLLNCIRGTKVVSVSATPGHTKHLQTIPIPSEHVVLIDSPGLAFPVLGLPRPLQAVIGTHQIAQTRDPQSGVAYLATHLKLERIYGLRKLDGDDSYGDNAWSPYELCESYARKKGYFVKHGKGALDVHRGSIEILQEAYEGRLVLLFAPPDIDWLNSAQFRKEVQPYLLLKVQLEEGIAGEGEK